MLKVDAEIAARAVNLLQAILEHKKRARTWEQEFYPISSGSEFRPGTPFVTSPEVILLLHVGIVQYWGTCQNENIPDSSLRMLAHNEEMAKEIIRQYVERLSSANANKLIP